MNVNKELINVSLIRSAETPKAAIHAPVILVSRAMAGNDVSILMNVVDTETYVATTRIAKILSAATNARVNTAML